MTEMPNTIDHNKGGHPKTEDGANLSVAVQFLGVIYMTMAGIVLFGGVAAALVALTRSPVGVLDYNVFAEIFGSKSALGRAAARFFFEAHRLAFIAVIPLSAATVAAGAAFRKRRPWARPVLEAATWIAIASVLVFGIGWLAGWLSVCLRYMADTGVGFGVIVSVFGGAFLGMLVLVLFLLPLRFLLITLRSGALREEFKRRGQFTGAN